MSFLGGLLLTDAVVAAVLISGMIEGLELYAGYGLAAMLILAVLSWGICRQILRRRIRATVRKSIIENIREL